MCALTKYVHREMEPSEEQREEWYQDWLNKCPYAMEYIIAQDSPNVTSLVVANE